MAVLDASALVALLNGEPGAATVKQLFEEPTRPSGISAINLAEGIDVLIRVYGIEESAVADAIDLLEVGGLDVLPIDARTAWQAGIFRASRYRKSTAELSHADCIAAVTARERAEPLVTSDRPLTRVARASGIEVIQIPDRFKGSR